MMDLLRDQGGTILAGLATTLKIVGFGFVLGALLGGVLGLVKGRSKSRWTLPITLYVEMFRHTPFLVQAMIIFAVFGVLRIRVAPDILGILAVALYTGAYMVEITRSAMLTVPRGQGEAAAALGLSFWPTLRLIILPQMLPFVTPATTNLLATVTKESAFLSAVSVAELTYSGQVAIAQTFKVFEIWAMTAILYLAVTLALQFAGFHLERRMRWTGRP